MIALTPLALHVCMWKEFIGKPLSQDLSCEKGLFGTKGKFHQNNWHAFT